MAMPGIAEPSSNMCSAVRGSSGILARKTFSTPDRIASSKLIWRSVMIGMTRFTMAVALVAISAVSPAVAERGQWSVEKVNRWYSAQPWLLGSNFVPSTAINELEMWQAATFDPSTIDRELGWAEGLGMNTMRVFLHNLLWQEDAKGFLERMEKFLQIADRHHIKITFVLLD